MSDSRFDDIFDAVASEPKRSSPAKQESKIVKNTVAEKKTEQSVNTTNSQVDDFWSSLDNVEKIRLNVDIPIPLNDRLSAKAKKLKQTKSELVRRLIEWALEE